MFEGERVIVAMSVVLLRMHRSELAFTRQDRDRVLCEPNSLFR